MADIVVRGLEDELVRRVRSDAALRGENLKDWMERVLEQETSGLVRKGKRQANGQKPYEADGRGTSVGLGGNEPQQTVQAGGARGVEKSAPNNFPKRFVGSRLTVALHRLQSATSALDNKMRAAKETKKAAE